MTLSRAMRSLPAAWWATVVLFLVHGLVVGTWVSRIPAIQSALHLNNGVLGMTLLSSAVGAVCTIPVTSWLLGRFGSRKVTGASSLAFCLAVALPGLAGNAAALAVALFVFGALASAMDVSMNTHGVEVEKLLGRPTMSRFHAMFSLGAMGGAGLGGWVAGEHIRPLVHFMAAGLIAFGAVSGVLALLLKTQRHAAAKAKWRLRKIPRVLLALSAIGFCILLAEGAMADWTAIYLHQVLHAGPTVAAEGYAAFAAAMALFRLAGDFITARLGPRRTVCVGSVLAATGLLFALAVSGPLWAFPGFVATGAGLSVIIPLVFGGGGRVPSVEPGAGIATVTGLGYIGFILGPPAIGLTAQVSSLRYALGIVVGCCLASALLSREMQSLEPKPLGPQFVEPQLNLLEPQNPAGG